MILTSIFIHDFLVLRASPRRGPPEPRRQGELFLWLLARGDVRRPHRVMALLVTGYISPGTLTVYDIRPGRAPPGIHFEEALHREGYSGSMRAVYGLWILGGSTLLYL